MLLSSAPDSAATVAKPDLKLCPEKLLFSIPANLKQFLINKTTVWSVNLLLLKIDPLTNLLKMGPDLIFEVFNHFFKYHK